MKKFYFLILSFIFLFLANNVVASTLNESFGSSLDKTALETGHIDTNAMRDSSQTRTLLDSIGLAIGVALSLVGIFFLVLIIYAGYTWMLARGNAQEVEKAKSTIINAVLGLLIISIAYAVTVFLTDIVKY